MRPTEAKVSAISTYLAPSKICWVITATFSSVVHPLTSLLSPTVDFTWSPECQNAFKSVKALLCQAPVLAAPDVSRPFKLEVDVSAVGLGAVLLQEDTDGVDHPVCYFSKKFNTKPSIPPSKRKRLPCCLLSSSLRFTWGLFLLNMFLYVLYICTCPVNQGA